MKTWRIPVVWQMTGIVEIEANTLREAMELAMGDEVGLPDGSYLEESFMVDDIREDEIRSLHNNNEPDEQDLNVCPVCGAPIDPRDGEDDGCGELHLRWFCESCGASGDAVIDTLDNNRFVEHILDEVVEKRGRWVPMKTYPSEYICSECGELWPDAKVEECPGCHAKMDVDAPDPPKVLETHNNPRPASFRVMDDDFMMF